MWEDMLKISPKVWQRFVVKLFKESPNRSMTVRQVIDNLIDNSTIGGSKDSDKMKYSNVPTHGKLRVFLINDDRFRVISKRRTDEYMWAGDDEE
jgi:hypothetical protein